VEVPGASSLRSLTKRTPPCLFLPPPSWPTPPTPTQPRTCLQRSFVSLPRSSSKVTEDTVADLQASFNSPSYHPTSQPNRPRPHSFRCSNLQHPSQVSRSNTLLWSTKISGAGTTPYSPPPAIRSGSRARFHPGCYPRISFRPINPEILPRNCSGYLGSDTCEPISAISGTREFGS